MNITQENVDALNAEIKIHLAPEDYRDNVNAELKKQAKNAAIRGFRPGKVPLSLIRNMAGMPVLMDELNKLIGRELNKYIKDQDLRILGEPLPKGEKKESDFDVNCNIDLEFAFEVGLAPTIELDLQIEDLPTRYEVTVSDDFINEEIRKNQDRYGEMTQPEKVEKGDIVYGKLVEVDAAGTPVEGGFNKLIVLNPERVKNEAAFTPFLDQEPEAVVPFDPLTINPDPEVLASILYMDKDELELFQGKSFQLTLKRINRIQPAALTPDFFFKVLHPEKAYRQQGPDEGEGVESEEEFRNLLRARIQGEFDENTKWYYRNQLREALLKHHSIDLPETFLKRWISETNVKKENNKKLTPEEVNEQYGSFSESVRWSLLVEEVKKAHPAVGVSDEELLDELRESIRKNVPDLTEEREQQIYQNMLRNEEFLQGLYNRRLDDKLNEVLEALLIPPTESIDAQAFLDKAGEA